jgi:hypothetical protein
LLCQQVPVVTPVVVTTHAALPAHWLGQQQRSPSATAPGNAAATSEISSPCSLAARAVPHARAANESTKIFPAAGSYPTLPLAKSCSSRAPSGEKVASRHC